MATATTDTSGQQRRLIFGIDFGTTYSGVSFALSGTAPGAIRTIQQWPDIDANYLVNEEVKAPTAIKYVLEGDEGGRTTTKWGYSVPLGAKDIRWFKLLLLDDKDLQKYLSPATMSRLTTMRDTIKASGKEVLDTIADYLRLLWEYVLKEVDGTIGRRARDGKPFTVVVTVPAIWKGYSRSRMHLAVKKAGILDDREAGPTLFHFASEPEAAAVARLTDLTQLECIKIGDCITVADFGGGTVDIISYEVTQVKPLRIREAVEGQGGICGAIFLDEAFRKLVIAKLGPENWDRVDKEDVERFLQESWEWGLKRKYTTKAQGWSLPMKQSFKSVRAEPLELAAEELLAFFKESYVITESLKLIKQQLAAVKTRTGKPAEFVLMVGGFGGSRFLKEAVDSTLEDGTTVLQGPDTSYIWSAVSRGAVMSVAEGLLDGEFAKVESRIARACYGLSYNSSWVEGVHDPRDKFWHPIEGCYRARDQMRWFLKKGDSSSKPEPFEMKLCRTYNLDDSRHYPTLHEGVWTYDGYDPPSRREANVVKLRTISHTSPIPFEKLAEKQNGEGKTIKIHRFRYAAMCFGDSVDISIIGDDGILTQENVDINSDIVHRPNTPPAVPAPPPPPPQRTQVNPFYDENLLLLPPPPDYQTTLTGRDFSAPTPRSGYHGNPNTSTPPFSPPPLRPHRSSSGWRSHTSVADEDSLRKFPSSASNKPYTNPSSYYPSPLPQTSELGRQGYGEKPGMKNPFGDAESEAPVIKSPTAGRGPETATLSSTVGSGRWMSERERDFSWDGDNNNNNNNNTMQGPPVIRRPSSSPRGPREDGGNTDEKEKEPRRKGKWKDLKRISSLWHLSGRKGNGK